MCMRGVGRRNLEKGEEGGRLQRGMETGSIWMHADQNRTGFLGRAEFYNALKLVTVAQSGRELTPDIVKAALYGPAAAKIPAPQINPMPSPASQSNPMAPSPQKSMGPPSVPQSYSVRGMQTPPNAGMNQQSFPSAALPMQGVVTQGLPGIVNAVGPRFTNPNISNDLSSVRPAGASMTGTSTAPIQGISPSVAPDGFGLGPSTGATAGLPNRAANPTTQEGFGLGSGLTPRPSRPQAPSFSLSSVPDKPQDASLSSLQPAARDLKTSSASGNGFSPDSFFGGDVFSVSASQLRQDVPASSVSATTTVNSSAIVPVAAGPQYSSGSVPAAAGSQYSSAIVPSAAGPQSSIKQSQVDPFQALTMTGGSSQLQQTSSLGIQSQVNSVQRASALAASGVSVGTNASASSESQTPWPRMTQSDIQKYMKVFTAVDADRDGRITGEEARNLFLSWRLPREVLKQVWDLSDQDNDSMLSLREFCTALYLMERYREGHSLPGVLPDSIKFDKTLLAITGPPVPPAYGSAAWQPSPGSAGVSGVQAVMPGSGLRPTAQGTLFHMDGAAQPMPQKSGIPVMEKNIGNQIIKEEQKALNSNLQEAIEADKKA
ncbi:hypothetical protein ACLOJK_002432 [Asimina triloba]